jgi:hypothetical protein
MMLIEETFEPQLWARNPHLQTIFGSLNIRLIEQNAMLDQAREVIVDGGEGVRLLGYHSRYPGNQVADLVLMIHGWEGSSDSAYILSTGRYLYERGFDIFRLNLRDHGNSHHLNEGLFHGALIEEILHAAGEISKLARGFFFIVGFSLGGNFALRVALRAPQAGIGNLKEVVCISPSLDPYKATVSIDRSLPIYRHYFLRKWKKSLSKKQFFFPLKYDFRSMLHLKSCMELTDAIMIYYPEFPTYMDYFRRYTLTGNIVDGLSIPVTIIASEDDPVVPVDDILGLKANGFMNRLIQPYGGHCGFLKPFPYGCWYERKIHDIFTAKGVRQL